MKKLNVGCGENIKKGYINLDIRKLPGVDVVWNLNKTPYPFKDNEFNEILALNVLEHIDDHSVAIREFHRILKPGGKVIIEVPHFTSATVWGDPTHKRGYSYISFDFFLKKHRYHRYFDFGFSKINKQIIFFKGLHIYNHLVEAFVNWTSKLTPKAPLYENTFLRSLFPALRLRFELIK